MFNVLNIYQFVGTVIKYIKLYYLYDITQDNKTPLQYAIESGHSDVVQILLDKGANIEAVDEVTNKYSLMLIL